MQCNDKSWQLALDTLLAKAHVIVMDLSGFTSANRGCEYELGKLIDQIPLERFFLIINKDTDQTFLHSVLEKAWQSRGDDSPNSHLHDPKIQLYEIDIDMNRETEESQLDWKKRLITRIDDQYLVGRLHQAALSGLSETKKENREHNKNVSWNDRLQLPKVVNLFIYGILGVYLLSLISNSWNVYFADRTSIQMNPP